MAEQVTDESVAENIASAIESAYGDAPAPKAAPVTKPASIAPTDLPQLEDEGEPEIEALPDEEPADEAPPAEEPEFEFETAPGQKEIVRGKEKIQELLAKGADYSRKTEEVARARDAIAAQYQQAQINQQFHQAVMGDFVELQALDRQLEQYNRIDWSTAIDTNFVEAMKAQEQRAQLKELKNQKLAQLNYKQAQFEQGQAYAAQQLQAAETGALLAKLPQWRNSETRVSEDEAIRKELANYGFRDAEVLSIMDHRMVLVARDAMKYRALQRNKADAVKQVRDAPAVSKPGASGAQSQESGKAKFAKFTQEFRRQGQKGQHRAQEASLEKMLSRTFK